MDLDYSDLLELALEMGLKEKDLKIISFSDSNYNDPFCELRISEKSVNFYGKMNYVKRKCVLEILKNLSISNVLTILNVLSILHILRSLNILKILNIEESD